MSFLSKLFGYEQKEEAPKPTLTTYREILKDLMSEKFAATVNVDEMVSRYGNRSFTVTVLISSLKKTFTQRYDLRNANVSVDNSLKTGQVCAKLVFEEDFLDQEVNGETNWSHIINHADFELYADAETALSLLTR